VCFGFHEQDLAQMQEAAKCLVDFRESQEIDPEAFERLVYIARSVAAYRPNNVVLYAEKFFNATDEPERSGTSTGKIFTCVLY
jgi:hypothetical protein